MTALVIVILLALAFDYTNGRHDAALITGPVIATGTLTPRHATIFASVCTFTAFIVFGLHVAATLGHGLVNPNAVSLQTIGVSLLAAAAWNLIAQKTGVPTSSSHALIGALTGAVAFSAGPQNIIWSGLIPTISAILIAPILGFIGASLITALASVILLRTNSLRMNALFRPLQILACGLLALSHGSNDAQKTMGIITLALISTGHLPSGQTPLWVVLACQAAMTAGTLSPQPARMLRTVSRGITRIRPWQSAIAQGSAGIVLSTATLFGIPVSSTHVQTGTLTGVGAMHSIGRIRWATILRMMISWVITMPAAALMAGIVMTLVNAFR